MARFILDESFTSTLTRQQSPYSNLCDFNCTYTLRYKLRTVRIQMMDGDCENSGNNCEPRIDVAL
jgi:hypothetical protein